MYNWQIKGWAEFIYDEAIIKDNALKFIELSGELHGVFKTFTDAKQQAEILDVMISEAVKTFEIEGEMLSREDVRSSFLNKLGIKTSHSRDKRADNVALLMLHMRNNFKDKLTEGMIKQWHTLLFSNSKYINAGVYRASDEPMQIISGVIGKEKVHYEAPPSKQIPKEMSKFVAWYNGFSVGNDTAKIIIKTAITHLYFEGIHPFEDGNGRIGRALIEKCLSESTGRQTIFSMSRTIESNRKQYYNELKRVQSTLNINDWLLYFSQLLIDAQQEALDVLYFSVKKAHFFDKYEDLINARQTKVINKMLDAGKDGFEGGMTTNKYMSITKSIKTTATRDLRDLVDKGILLQKLAGRSTNYTLNI